MFAVLAQNHTATLCFASFCINARGCPCVCFFIEKTMKRKKATESNLGIKGEPSNKNFERVKNEISDASQHPTLRHRRT